MEYLLYHLRPYGVDSQARIEETGGHKIVYPQSESESGSHKQHHGGNKVEQLATNLTVESAKGKDAAVVSDASSTNISEPKGSGGDDHIKNKAEKLGKKS